MQSRSSVREAYLAPLVLCAIMALCAAVTGQLADISARSLLGSYLRSFALIAVFSLFVSVFWWAIRLALVRADDPLPALARRLKERVVFLLLPAVVFPIFLASFTATKCAIPFLVGYTWDPFWAAADRWMFGDDVWRISRQWLGDGPTRPLEWLYAAGWMSVLVLSAPLVAFNGSARSVGKFYTGLMLSWLVGGAAMAYLFSAAGPVFAHLVTTDATVQFVGLRAVLDATLDPTGAIRMGQVLLPRGLHAHGAAIGGGVSAMPSMHLATVTIYVCAARRTRWLIPAILFWTIIFVGSAYFGYHYWVDGIVAAIVTVICWAAADRLVEWSATSVRGDATPHVDDSGVIGGCPLPSAP